ncbi:MAG: cyclase family protein [Acidobacteriota bacterium]|nr:cyclase family protein [Acidobacteriota bacterium]
MKVSPLDDFFDLSIPLRFGADQPNVYGVDQSASKPCEYGNFVGDTRLGGSVNFEEYRFIPHCNGTHTECVGHITEERISVRDCLRDVFSESLLVSVKPENAIESGENYPYEVESRDEFVTHVNLENAISNTLMNHGTETNGREKIRPDGVAFNPRSLIIRTLPNDNSKLTRRYDKPVPPFFSNDAIAYVVESGFKHLLVDLPSIDRLYDDGMLSNHRIFWAVEPESRTLNRDSRRESTVTELIYVPDEIKDGRYILNLQIAPFEADAAPSRPVLFNSSQ